MFHAVCVGFGWISRLRHVPRLNLGSTLVGSAGYCQEVRRSVGGPARKPARVQPQNKLGVGDFSVVSLSLARCLLGQISA